MTQILNRPDQKEKRRLLRRKMPSAEVLLWAKIRNRQLAGAKFKRQVSVGPFVLDFYCPTAKLAIELDGDSHEGETAERYDLERQEGIESLGIVFVRFSNQQIYSQMNEVLQTLAEKLNSHV